MSRKPKAAFNLRKPLIVVRPFRLDSRRYAKGHAFDWRKHTVAPRKIQSWYNAGYLEHIPEMSTEFVPEEPKAIVQTKVNTDDNGNPPADNSPAPVGNNDDSNVAENVRDELQENASSTNDAPPAPDSLTPATDNVSPALQSLTNTDLGLPAELDGNTDIGAFLSDADKMADYSMNELREFAELVGVGKATKKVDLINMLVERGNEIKAKQGKKR